MENPVCAANKNAPADHHSPPGHHTPTSKGNDAESLFYHGAETLASFERRGGSDVRLCLDRSAVRPFDLRRWADAADGCRRPTRQGVTLSRAEMAALMVSALVEDPALMRAVLDAAAAHTEEQKP